MMSTSCQLKIKVKTFVKSGNGMAHSTVYRRILVRTPVQGISLYNFLSVLGWLINWGGGGGVTYFNSVQQQRQTQKNRNSMES